MYSENRLACSFEGNNLYLRCLRPSDVAQSYIDSLNNEQEYLETKDDFVTLESQKQYVAGIEGSGDQLILGLFCDNVLIATSGAQTISKTEFSMGIFILDAWRGRGLGKVLVWMVCTLLNQTLGVLVFKAGMKIDNYRSLGSFIRCGFIIIETSATYHKVELSIVNLKKPEFLVPKNNGQ